MKISKKLLIIIISIIISVSLVTLYVLTPNVYSGEINQLTLIENQGVSCKAWSSAVELDVNNKKVTYNPKTIFFPVKTEYNVLSTKTGNELKLLDTSANLECTATTSSVVDFNIVGGRVTTQFMGLTENGQWITLKSESREISTFPRPVLDRAVKIPSGAISASEIDSKLTSTKEYWITKVKAVVTGYFEFKGKSTGDLTNKGVAAITQDVYVKLYNPIIDPEPSVSTVVNLKSLSPSTFDLKDYDGSTLALTITGELPEWKDTEGLPYVDIYTPDRKLFGKFALTSKRLVSSSTNTYEFKAINVNIPKEPLGYWQVIMHSNGDVRKTTNGNPSVDVLQFRILDTTEPPSTTCPEGQELTDVGCVTPPEEQIPPEETTPSEDGTAFAFIAYKLTFNQGGIDVGKIPEDDSIKIEFAPLDFVGQPKGADEQFETMTLIQTIDTSGLNGKITNMQYNTNLNIDVDGTPISDSLKLNEGQQKRIRLYSSDGNYYVINHILLNTEDLNQFLISNGYVVTCKGLTGNDLTTCENNRLKDGQKITVSTMTEGNFDLITGTETKSGSFAGLGFTYSFDYVNDFDDPDECKGLSGEDLLLCRGSDPNNCIDFIDIVGDEHCDIKETQTGGECEGLTPQECLEQGKNNPDPDPEKEDGGDLSCELFGFCGDNPKGSPGTVGLCESGESKSACLERIKNSINDKVPQADLFGFDPFIVLIALGVFVVFIIIIVLVRRR